MVNKRGVPIGRTWPIRTLDCCLGPLGLDIVPFFRRAFYTQYFIGNHLIIQSKQFHLFASLEWQNAQFHLIDAKRQRLDERRMTRRWADQSITKRDRKYETHILRGERPRVKSKRESVVRICKKEGFGGDCFPSLWLFSSAEESAGSRGIIFVFDFDLPKIREAKVA